MKVDAQTEKLFMKAEYRQICHTKTEKGWKPGKFQPTALMHPEDAASINRHFNEHGIRAVPKKEYERYLQNARLIN